MGEQREGEQKEMTSLQEHSDSGPRPMALLLSLTTLPTSLPINRENRLSRVVMVGLFLLWEQGLMQLSDIVLNPD